MSDSAEQKIAHLERELRAAQEILFFVLDTTGPVVFKVQDSKPKMNDHFIDIEMNTETEEWTAQVVAIDEQ